MTDKPVILDQHRGMAAQRATEVRRLLTEVVANEQALRETQDRLEAQLIAAPATTWERLDIYYLCLGLVRAARIRAGRR